MLITECPWCDGPARVADALVCEGCSAVVQIAADEEPLARAA